MQFVETGPSSFKFWGVQPESRKGDSHLDLVYHNMQGVFIQVMFFSNKEKPLSNIRA